MRAVLVVVSLAAATARADGDPVAPAASKAKCACPQPRLLARGSVVLDGATTASAWLHQDAILAPFSFAQPGAPAAGVDAPILQQVFDPSPYGAPVPSSGALVRASAGGAYDGELLLGVLRKKEKTPKDVVRARLAPTTDAPAMPPPGAAPSLKALWLAPLEERNRPGCGAFLTHLVAYETHEGSAPVEGFVVVAEQGGARTAAVVDVRMAQTFGVGRVEACGEGLPLAPGAAKVLEVRPVSALHGVGDAWRFADDGSGRADPARDGALPPTADAALAASPFPRPGQDEGPELLLKEIAASVMGGLVALAAVVAGFYAFVKPRRKRMLKEFPCPACGRPIPIDLKDPDTDGVMCPSCGAASVWKGADTTGKATVAKIAP